MQTYQLKEQAATQERTLREAEAKAEQQKGITASQISIEIKNNEGRAALAFAQQAAERVKVEAGANATRMKVEADATAERLRLEGEGEERKVEHIRELLARCTNRCTLVTCRRAIRLQTQEHIFQIFWTMSRRARTYN